MSRRGTTPTQTFELPFDTSFLNKVIISYVQGDEILFEKRNDDCAFEGNVITIRLSQEDTLKIDHRRVLKIQLKFLFVDGNVDASDDIITSYDDIFNEEVMV